MYKDNVTDLPLHGASLRGKECCAERECGEAVEVEVPMSFVKRNVTPPKKKGDPPKEAEYGVAIIGYCLDHGVRFEKATETY